MGWGGGRVLLPMIAVLALGACAAHDPFVSGTNTVTAGNWQIERQTDRVTGAPISSAILMTRTVANSVVAFPPPAMLQLLCFKGQPTISIAFQFKIGGVYSAELAYRFDDKPGHGADARFLASHTKAIIEDPAEVAQFVSELSASNTLYVHIRSMTAGRTSAEFKLDGAPAAISAAFAGCPVQTAKPADASIGKRKTGAR